METTRDNLAEKACIFCQIIAGTSPCHRVWEDDHYLAFLSIFPNTDGFTVVIPKYHLSSYLFDHPLQEVNNLMAAVQKVSRILVDRLPNVARTALIFEGYGIDHLHAKVVPLHGTGDNTWMEHIARPKDKFGIYPGYVSSHDAERESDDKLAQIAHLLNG